MELSEALLVQVKQELDITWSDKDTDKRMNNIALASGHTIAHQIGVGQNFDFSEPGIENTLFLALCLYLWNKIEIKVFYENYRPLILQARAIHEVEQVSGEAVEDGNI